MNGPAGLRAILDRMLGEAGFVSWGVAEAVPLEREHEMLLAWLASGRHGSLEYMRRRSAVLRDPAGSSFLRGARSIVMASLPVTGAPARPGSLAERLARHARGADYHEAVASRLRPVLGAMKGLVPGLAGRVFVDTAPVMEKAWAQRAGLGWIGRNGLLVQPRIGSFTVLGGIAVTAPMDPDRPAHDGCGDCTACVDACPVSAIGPDRMVDARACLSCLTVERTAPLDPQRAALLAGRSAFGCDACQLACPHNESPPAAPPDLDPVSRLQGLTPEAFLALDDDAAHRALAGTAMLRTGVSRLRESLAASCYASP